MDTLSALFLGLLFLFSTVGNVSGQIPTGKDEHRTGGADTLKYDLCYKNKVCVPRSVLTILVNIYIFDRCV